MRRVSKMRIMMILTNKVILKSIYIYDLLDFIFYDYLHLELNSSVMNG